MANDLLTPAQFAQSIKAKYPDYASVPDDVLAAKMLEKYPEYRDRVSVPKFAADNAKDANGQAMVRGLGVMLGFSPAEMQASTARISAASPVGDTLADLGLGALKSAAGTVVGAAQLAHQVPGVRSAMDAAGLTPDRLVAARQAVAPTNTAEQIGKGAGDVGQFFIPGPAVTKAKAALSTGKGVLDALVRAGVEGASAATVQSLQRGTTEGALKTAALTGGVSAGMEGAVTQGQKGLNWLGKRIEMSLLKPTVPSLEGQSPKTMIENVFKYNVGGTLGESYDKVQAKLKDLTSKLRVVLKASSANGAGVSLNRIADDVAQSYLNNPQAKAALSRIVDHVEFSLNGHGIPVKSGVLDLADANIAKQAVGDMGAWLHDMHGKVVSDADKVTEAVANRLYDHLKTAIETNATGPVKSINKAISDLIPLRQAIIRRIPVEERANVLNMGDLFGLSSHTLGLSIANRILKSGGAADMFVRASQAADVPSSAGVVAARAVAGLSGQSQ
jgi:hypothetical protein